jgi:hypothetical protein
MKTKMSLTEKEKLFILENYEKMTRNEMATALAMAYNRVKDFCDANNLIKPVVDRTGYSYNKNQGPEKLNIKRPPAIYSNRSREEVLNYYENLEIN